MARVWEGRHASTHHRVRRVVDGADSPTVIAVASDRSLIADAVSAALSGSDLVIVSVAWPGDRRDPHAGWSSGSDPPELGLILCDLDPQSLEAARWVVDSYPTRWLLLTEAPRGPLWGAMFEVGVARILPNTTTMAEVFEVITALREGVIGGGPKDRGELVKAWHRVQAERAEARARVSSLTQREREVLRMLHVGLSVHEIAERNGVALPTVRSQVRSVLHKLGVNSQLAAAAYFDKWGAE